MKINNIELDINKLTQKYSNNSFLRKINNLYLSNYEISILKKYNINYNFCSDMNSLIFLIEEVLNVEEIDELEEISKNIAERTYYNFTNK